MNARLTCLAATFFLLTLGACRPAPPPLDKQVVEALDRFEVILGLGITGMLTLTLVDGKVHSAIVEPTQAELEEFFILFTEQPLCQEFNEESDIVNCIVQKLTLNGCVRIATCKTCIYPCS